VAGVGVEPTETGLWAPSRYRSSLRSLRWRPQWDLNPCYRI